MLMNPLKFSFLFMAPQGLVAMFYFLYNIALVYDPTLIPGVSYDPNIAYIAHVIGFTVGIPFGISWSKRWPRNLLITLGLFGIYLAILAILATFFGLRLPLGLLKLLLQKRLKLQKDLSSRPQIVKTMLPYRQQSFPISLNR